RHHAPRRRLRLIALPGRPRDAARPKSGLSYTAPMELDPRVGAFRRQATSDPEGFWARAAAALPWFRRWDQVLDWQPSTFRWFVGGRTNLAYNCLDRHVEQGRGGQAALIYVNERGERRVY